MDDVSRSTEHVDAVFGNRYTIDRYNTIFRRKQILTEIFCRIYKTVITSIITYAMEEFKIPKLLRTTEIRLLRKITSSNEIRWKCYVKKISGCFLKPKRERKNHVNRITVSKIVKRTKGKLRINISQLNTHKVLCKETYKL